LVKTALMGCPGFEERPAQRVQQVYKAIPSKGMMATMVKMLPLSLVPKVQKGILAVLGLVQALWAPRVKMAPMAKIPGLLA
jgi:hypothetical protein